MKSIVYLIILLLIQTYAFGQQKLVKDLDNDGLNDTAFIDIKNSKIVCCLSTQNFKRIESNEIETDQTTIKSTKNGFEFNKDWMRAGYKNQFRYEAKTKKIQLIGMSRYELGPANGNGSGESSVNLLTNEYIGNWNFYDKKVKKLIKAPTIRTKMVIAKTYLETFSDETYFKYAEECSYLYINQCDSIKPVSVKGITPISKDIKLAYLEYDKEFKNYGIPVLLINNKQYRIKGYGEGHYSGGGIISISPNKKFIVLDAFIEGYVEDGINKTQHYNYFCVIVDVINYKVVDQMQSDCGEEWNAKNQLLSGGKILYDPYE